MYCCYALCRPFHGLNVFFGAFTRGSAALAAPPRRYDYTALSGSQFRGLCPPKLFTAAAGSNFARRKPNFARAAGENFATLISSGLTPSAGFVGLRSIVVTMQLRDLYIVFVWNRGFCC